MTKLYARANRVIESINIMTSSPISTRRLALSNNSSATLRDVVVVHQKLNAQLQLILLNVQYQLPLQVSPTNKTNNLASGLLVIIALAISLSNEVLPALGGATMSPRCPKPIGVTKSMIRVE